MHQPSQWIFDAAPGAFALNLACIIATPPPARLRWLTLSKVGVIQTLVTIAQSTMTPAVPKFSRNTELL